MHLLEELVRVCDQADRQAIYAAIVVTTNADGILRPEELAFLDEARRTLEVQSGDAEKLQKAAEAGTLEFSLPKKPVPRVLAFAYVIEAAAIDGQIDSAERKLAQILAQQVQIEADSVNSLLEARAEVIRSLPKASEKRVEPRLPRKGQDLASRLEIGGLDARVIDVNEVYTNFGWKVEITNPGSEPVVVSMLEVEFLDASGFTLANDFEYGFAIQPGETYKARGNSLIEPYVADQVTSLNATVRS